MGMHDKTTLTVEEANTRKYGGIKDTIGMSVTDRFLVT